MHNDIPISLPMRMENLRQNTTYIENIIFKPLSSETHCLSCINKNEINSAGRLQ